MMKASRRSVWLLSVSLVVLGGCKSDGDDEPAADPLDDPWVDAIATGDEGPAGPEALPSVGTEDAPLALAEADSLPEAQPEAQPAVVATPTKREAQPSAATSDAPAASSDSATVPVDVPAQPADEAPGTVAEPESIPSSESAKPESPPPITAADFHGSYRYVGGSAQRDEVTAAIEATVIQLSKAIQGIARKRLTQANPVDSSLAIVVAGDTITTTFESGFDVSCVIDGGTVNTTGIDGGKLKVRVRSKGSKLVQHMEGKDGARTIVYVLSADRKQLTVHHKITADRLPAPLIYRLSYSRK